MGWNDSAASRAKQRYNDAYSAYSKSISDYKNATDSYKTEMEKKQREYDAERNAAKKTNANEQKKYEGTLGMYTGNAGYQNSVDMAKKNANDLSLYQAQQAANQVRTAARNAGMTKAQAAALASNQVANAYLNSYANNFANQQGQVASQGNAAVQGQLSASQMGIGNAQQNAANALNSANLAGNAYGTVAGNYGNIANMDAGIISAALSEGANEYNRRRQNIGDYTLGLGNLSDERLKEYRKIDGVLKRKQKRDYKKLLCEARK